jgi:hypothetical protein
MTSAGKIRYFECLRVHYVILDDVEIENSSGMALIASKLA